MTRMTGNGSRGSEGFWIGPIRCKILNVNLKYIVP